MKISIIPGINNSGPQHWQTFWEHQYGFTRIKQEDWDHPVFEEWKDNLVESIESNKYKKNNILIAHSLGCLLTVKSLSTIQDYIGGLFLVAVPNPDTAFFSGQLKTFRDIPCENLKIPGYLVYSGNDEFSTTDFSIKYGKIWGLKTINAGRLGHINGDSNLAGWEEGYKLFTRLMEEIQNPKTTKKSNFTE
jgi:predicted alpha/beta hydrolase family esterase